MEAKFKGFKSRSGKLEFDKSYKVLNLTRSDGMYRMFILVNNKIMEIQAFTITELNQNWKFSDQDALKV